MAIFNSKLLVYQRVTLYLMGCVTQLMTGGPSPCICHVRPSQLIQEIHLKIYVSAGNSRFPGFSDWCCVFPHWCSCTISTNHLGPFVDGRSTLKRWKTSCWNVSFQSSGTVQPASFLVSFWYLRSSISVPFPSGFPAVPVMFGGSPRGLWFWTWG